MKQFLTLVTGLLMTIPVLADSVSESLEADYYSLLEQEYSTEAIPIPPDGITWKMDTALWHLESGNIQLQRPLASGEVTGFIFDGRGIFSIEVPDPIELRQLRRFTKNPHLEDLTTPFDRLIVQTVSVVLEGIELTPGELQYAPSNFARQRQDFWFRLHGDDVVSRVVAALARPGDIAFRANMRTDAYGWLTYDYDDERVEEIQVEYYNEGYPYIESWLSLDRRDDRLASGRPGSSYRPRIDIIDVSIEADLTQAAKQGTYGQSKVRPLKGNFVATVTLQPNHDEDTAIRLTLTPVAKVLGVQNQDGREMRYLRDHLGKRSSAFDNDVYDDALLILLDEPLVSSEELKLTVEYEMRIYGFGPGRDWYPSTEFFGNTLHDLHTGRMTFVTKDEYAVRSMGRLEVDEDEGKTRRTTWSPERPVKMMSFLVAKNHHEELLQYENLPEVAVFGSVKGYLAPEDLRRIGIDVTNSMNFYQELFDSEVDASRLQVGTIPAGHGQAFDGLLHMSDITTVTDNVARVEMFRAHEVAHQWWGHKVGWQSYRDQWLSEGIAHYSAMMFVEQNVKGGPRYFRQMLQAYSDEITGSLGSSGSQFARPVATRLNRRGMDRMGPIGHGFRSAVGETPTAYSSQAYLKGSLVMHMLRVLIGVMTSSDEAFFDVLRLYADRMQGDYATTQDMQDALTEVVPVDWDWFFDEWIYGAEIPTYSWSYKAEPGPQGTSVILSVDQQDVNEGFRMPVPVRFEFSNGDTLTKLALVDKPSQEITFDLDTKPKRVIFNPDNSVLARTKKR